MNIKLDKDKTYYLGDLNEDELYKIAKITNYTDNFKQFKKDSKECSLYFSSEWVLDYANRLPKENEINAKELFLPKALVLEDIQVDCRELTEEQIEKMKTVVVNSGYKLWDDEDAFDIFGCWNYFRMDEDGQFFIIFEIDDKTTITYEKFMELFTSESTPLKFNATNWQQVELKNAWEQPAEEHKIEETLRFLTEKNIFLTPEQYRLLWE